jgi:hypothetical protein
MVKLGGWGGEHHEKCGLGGISITHSKRGGVVEVTVRRKLVREVKTQKKPVYEGI